MNWEAFIAMNGQGAYVWSSFGLCIGLMAAEVSGLHRRILMSRTATTRKIR